MRREAAAIEEETNRVRGMEINTDETEPDAEESPMPVKGDIFKDYDPTGVQKQIRKEAAAVQDLGGGEFPGTEGLSRENDASSGISVESMTHKIKSNSNVGSNTR